ncbi:MAG: phytanoyl-CoA dioxygenase family protein [Rhodospirillaceae bacterium]|nr:phytanoyl-CoA dioxygenase family protein [Rhodospirillaceae bacterium]
MNYAPDKLSSFNIPSHVEDLKRDGLTVIPNLYTKQQCADHIERLDSIAAHLTKKGVLAPSGDCRNIWNFFKYDKALLDLVYNPVADAIFKTLLDEDYVLLAGNVINRQIYGEGAAQSAYGEHWHTDSRYLGGKRLQAGFTFGFIVMLDGFSNQNGGTHFVRGTQKSLERPDQNGNYEYEVMTGDTGSAVIVDSGLWHRGGPSTHKRRWGVFSLYGPWFVKPYWRYWDMVTPEYAKDLSPELKRLFHFDAVPPFDEEERIYTLRKNYLPKT